MPWASGRALQELDPARAGLDLDRSLPVADRPHQLILSVMRDLQRKIGLDVAARGLDLHFGAERGRGADRDVARARLRLERAHVAAELRCNPAAAGLE